MAQPKSQRCSTCDLNWPLQALFTSCPYCEEQTWACTDEVSMSAEEALKVRRVEDHRRRKHRAFNEYYARREAGRTIAEAELICALALQDETVEAANA